MKKIIIILILSLAAKVGGIEKYNDIYGILGDKQSQAKFQVSLKYNLFHPATKLYLGYTQTSFWDILNESSPFKTTDYKPEIFFAQKTKKYLIQIGLYEHNSNGRDGKESRSIDKSYLKLGYNFGLVGIESKVFYAYNIEYGNRDILEYKGIFDCKLKINFPDKTYFKKTQIYYKFGIGGKKRLNNNSWHEIGFKFRTILPVFKPYWFWQIWHGYGENLLDYNKKETKFRAGIILN